MKYRAFATVLALAILLSGCNSWPSREYHWTEEYQMPQSEQGAAMIQVSNLLQLQNILGDMVENGVTRDVISVEKYPAGNLESDFSYAVSELKNNHPIAAYAVDQVSYETGTSAGTAVVVVKISYMQDRIRVGDIVTVQGQSAAMEVLNQALSDYRSDLVLYIENYTSMDFAKIVKDYAMQYPQTVMELPEVTFAIYPETGKTRVVELKFNYKTDAELLKDMQSKVEAVLDDAALHIGGSGTTQEKYFRLYKFLQERYQYTFETTTTPAYSLLYQGVGDSWAFTMVYAAMCRQAGLECFVVAGTRDGVEYYWNIVGANGNYHHLDLLRCMEENDYDLRADWDMADYVWDYDDYPDCGLV